MKYCCKEFRGFVGCDYGYIEIGAEGEVFIVDEGGNLIFEISYCPFCGSKLILDKRT